MTEIVSVMSDITVELNQMNQRSSQPAGELGQLVVFSYFCHPLKEVDGDAQNCTTLGDEVPTDKKVQTALGKVALKAFNNDRHAYRRQVQYMRYQLYFTTSNFKKFELRLKQLNKYLKYFPLPPGKRSVSSLTDDNLMISPNPWNITNRCYRTTTIHTIKVWKSLFSTLKGLKQVQR